MKKKKILACFSVWSMVLFSGTGSFVVNATSIIPNEKPEIIQGDTNYSGKINSYLDKQEDSMDKVMNKDENNKEQVSNPNNLDKTQDLDEQDLDETEEELLPPDHFLEETDMTISGFGDLIISRMLDVVTFFQGFAKPFTIVMFILSALLVVVSIVFGTNKAKLGFLGMMLSILAYVGAMYAPDLVLFFAGWLSV